MSTPAQILRDVLVLAPQPFFQERGTPIAVRLLVEELADAGYTVDLLTFHEGGPFAYPGVELLRTPALPGLVGLKPGFSLKKLVCDLLMLCSAVPLLKKRRYRVVHAVEESVFIAQLLASLFRVPFLYDMDSLLSQQLGNKFPVLQRGMGLLRWFEKQAMRQSSGVLAVCASLQERARQEAPAVPAAVLEDINLADAPSTVPTEIRDRCGIQGCLLMYVGNLESYQGIDLLLSAFAGLPQDNSGLVIIGGRKEDIAAYSQKSRALGIGERVHFLGPRPLGELGLCLAQADILLSPRIQGSNTPMKIYSYLASGKPVIATRLPTHTQVLDSSIALLCAPEPEAFAAAMQALIQDAGRRTQLGQAGRERAEARYSRAAYRNKLRNFYLKTVGPPPG